MNYSRQMKIAADSIEQQLTSLSSDWIRFAWLGAKSFESATTLLFSVNGKESIDQFIAHCCIMNTSLKLLEAFDGANEIWKTWPKKPSTFGRYHFAGSSALNVAALFANSMSGEIAISRLKAYPEQFIEGKEFDELKEWQVSFRSEIHTRRPELANMEGWEIHQGRGIILNDINLELLLVLEKIGDKEKAEAIKRLSERESKKETENVTEWKQLSEIEQIEIFQRRLMGFFRRWETKPTASDLLKSNNYFRLTTALPHFQQEFDDVFWLAYQALRIADARKFPIPSTRCFCEMFRHYDIETAKNLKYEVSAELSSLLQAFKVKQERKKTAKKKTGRPSKTKLDRESEQIVQAWKSGCYKTYDACDRELKKEEGTTKKVMDRYRKLAISKEN